MKTTGVVRGVVRGPGGPIGGAVVLVVPQVAGASSAELPSARTVTWPGLVSLYRPDLDVCPGGEIGLSLDLAPGDGAAFDGDVVDERGRPLAGARVRIVRYSEVLGTYLLRVAARKAFDALIFVDSTTRARPTPTGLRPAR